IPSRSRANPCESARVSPSDSPHGGPVHHASGRHAPFRRNGCTIPAVAMHHHPRSSCTFGAAYALGDDFKKQSKTEVAATLVYGNGKKEENINYHILKTTYYEADPNEITGLNVDALNVLFNPESAN